MEKVLRSFIHERFPLELRVQIELLSRRRDISNEEKHEEFIKLLQESDVGEFSKLGPGTNRYAVKIDGFVVKVATDHDGKIDNLKEFKMAKRLFPHVAKTYEVSENGTLLIAEYVPPFESYTEMCRYATQIKAILSELSSVYLIGDVGVAPKNYSNWGIRVGTNQPVCLDFAYVYEVSSKLFVCRHCKNNAMLVPDPEFNILICPACQHKYVFSDIRARIGNDIHRHEIGDLSEEGYRLTESFVPTQLTESRSYYLAKKQKPKDTKKKKKLVSEITTEEELQMQTSDLTKSMSGVPFAPAPVYINAVSRPTKGSDQFNQTAISIPREETPQDKPAGEVAFSCEMNLDEDIPIKVTTVAREAVVVQRPDETGAVVINAASKPAPAPQPEPAFEGEVVGDGDSEPVEELMEIPEGFMDEASDAISKFSNKAETYMRNINLYEKVREYLPSKRRLVSEREFYRVTQNAIYRSLAGFMNFQEISKPRDNGQGMIKTFIPQEDPTGKDYWPTLMFFCRCWTENIIRDSEDACEVVEKYRNTHATYMGIQVEWLKIFRKRLESKMSIDLMGINAIQDILRDVFCVELPAPTEPEPDPEPEEEPEAEIAPLDQCTTILNTLYNEFNGADDFSLDDMTEIEIFRCNSTATDAVFGLYADLVRVSIYGTMDEKIIMNHHYGDMEVAVEKIEKDLRVFKDQLINLANQKPASSFAVEMDPDVDTDGEDDEDTDENPIEGVSVEISRAEHFDYIRVVSRDPDDTVAIPFYVPLDSVNPNDVEYTNANGCWNWLTHLTPRLTFQTQNPSKYLAVNNIDPIDENVVRFVVLGTLPDEYFMMGLYILEGIYEVDGDEAALCLDEEIVAKINAIVINNMGNSAISFCRWHGIIPPVSEEDIADLVDSIDMSGDEEDDGDEDPMQALDEMSAVAAAVLTAEPEDQQEPIPEPDPQPAIAVQVPPSPVPDHVEEPSAPKKNVWKPIRRGGK